MNVFLWSLPILAVMATTLSGWLGSVGAAALGVALAAATALVDAPHGFTVMQALEAAATGVWIGVLVGAVILSGLFFRDVAAARDSGTSVVSGSRRTARAACFDACFLIGPFAETATGVGVGQVATTAALRGLGMAPLHVASLALFSQMLVPWGAMANGTIVGAAFGGLPPAVLGQHSAILTVPLLMVWLPAFWIFAQRASLDAGLLSHVREAAWTAGIAIVLVLANEAFDPEVAGLAALGPLLGLRFALDARAQSIPWRPCLGSALPYGALVAGLVFSRHGASFMHTLGDRLTLKPLADAPGWNLLTHPVSWLVVLGILTALVSDRPLSIPTAARKAWHQGRRSVLTVCLFLMMAQLMAKSGITDAIALALHDGLGPMTVLIVPLLAGVFGFITGSSNAANGLLMKAQVAFAAEAGLDVGWIAAVQNTAAAAMTMLSPLRVAMACALAGRTDLERSVYARCWPLGASAIAVLLGICALMVVVVRNN